MACPHDGGTRRGERSGARTKDVEKATIDAPPHRLAAILGGFAEARVSREADASAAPVSMVARCVLSTRHSAMAPAERSRRSATGSASRPTQHDDLLDVASAVNPNAPRLSARVRARLLSAPARVNPRGVPPLSSVEEIQGYTTPLMHASSSTRQPGVQFCRQPRPRGNDHRRQARLQGRVDQRPDTGQDAPEDRVWHGDARRPPGACASRC
jgi:hypothetical protein